MYIHSLTGIRYRKSRVLGTGTFTSDIELTVRSTASIVVNFFFDAAEEAAKLDEALAAFNVEDGTILTGAISVSHHGVKNVSVEDRDDFFRLIWENRHGMEFRISAFR